MAYKIISVDNNVNTVAGTPTALGISYKSNDRIFTSIYTTTEQSLENLKNLLLTRVGERYGYPQFGSHLLNVLFQPITDELKSEIHELITGPVSVFLPYINIDAIDVTTQLDDPNMLEYTVSIKITFSVGNFDTRAILLQATAQGTLTVTEV